MEYNIGAFVLTNDDLGYDIPSQPAPLSKHLHGVNTSQRGPDHSTLTVESPIFSESIDGFSLHVYRRLQQDVSMCV